MKRLMLVGVLGSFLFACGGASIAERGCERDDECNFLPAGTSVNECVEQIENQLDMLTQSQRNDLERVIDSCLEFETCAAYDACLNQ